MALEDVLREAVAPLESALTTAPLEDQIGRLTEQMSRLQTVSEAVVDATLGNTRTVASQVLSAVPGVSSGGGIGQSLLGSLGLGLGVMPLIRGLTSLFGGGDGEEAPPLTPFELPASVRVNAGISSAVPGTVFSVDQGQGGLPRPVTNPAPAQVTVQVQALDTQSFLDRSGDIALAVRQAMLESNVLSDVIREA